MDDPSFSSQLAEVLALHFEKTPQQLAESMAQQCAKTQQQQSNDDYNTRILAADSVVRDTIKEFLSRAEYGKEKYKADLDRTDLPDMAYLQHLKEELMDATLYLNKFIQMKTPLDNKKAKL